MRIDRVMSAMLSRVHTAGFATAVALGGWYPTLSAPSEPAPIPEDLAIAEICTAVASRRVVCHGHEQRHGERVMRLDVSHAIT